MSNSQHYQAQSLSPEDWPHHNPVQYHDIPSSQARYPRLPQQLHYSWPNGVPNFYGSYPHHFPPTEILNSQTGKRDHSLQSHERGFSADTFATRSPCSYCSNDLPAHDTWGNERWPCSQCGSNQNFVPPAYYPWPSSEHQSELQHPSFRRQDRLSEPVITPIEYPIAPSGLLNPSLPSPNSQAIGFVSYQNTHFISFQPQVSVPQRLQREPKSAKENACLPRGTSSKSRHGGRRKKPQNRNTSSKAKADKRQKRYQKITRDIPLFYKSATEWFPHSPKYLSPGTLKGTSEYLNSTASSTSPLITIRIEAPSFDCSLCAAGSSDCLITHIQSEEGIGTGVLAAVPLWNGQLDLAVEPASVGKVSDQFTNLTRYRLEVTDPLFLPQSVCSQEQTPLGVLQSIYNKYQQWHRTTGTDRSNGCARIEVWFAMEIKDLKERIKDLEASVRICDR